MIDSSKNNPLVYRKITTLLKIRHTIDSMVVKNNKILGHGWLSYDNAVSLSESYLLVEFQDGIKKYRCEIVKRPDLEKLNSLHNIVNSGFILTANFSKNKIKKISLECTFIDQLASKVCISLPVSRSERIRRIKRVLGHVRRGEIRTIFNKIHRHAKSIAVKMPKARANDDAKALRKLCAVEKTSLALIVDHNLGGGANLYRKQLIDELQKNGKVILLLYYDISQDSYILLYLSPTREIRAQFKKLDAVYVVLSSLCLKEIYFNNCFSYKQSSLVPSFLVKLRKKTKAQFIIAVNDYFMICPSFNLLDYSGTFCGIPSLKECHKCLSCHTSDVVSISDCKDIASWRLNWENCLQAATQIRCFSNSSRQILSKAYPQLDIGKVICVPHQVDYLPNRKPKMSLKPMLNIGVVGSIQYHKGAKIICEMAHIIAKQRLPIKISVIGSLSGNASSSVLTVYGPYKQEQLTDIIEATGANVFFIPSICPETFSFATSELMQLEVPLAVFNIGAPAERVKNYRKGVIIEEINAEVALVKLVEFYHSLCLEQQPLIIN